MLLINDFYGKDEFGGLLLGEVDVAEPTLTQFVPQFEILYTETMFLRVVSSSQLFPILHRTWPGQMLIKMYNFGLFVERRITRTLFRWVHHTLSRIDFELPLTLHFRFPQDSRTVRS